MASHSYSSLLTAFANNFVKNEVYEVKLVDDDTVYLGVPSAGTIGSTPESSPFTLRIIEPKDLKGEMLRRRMDQIEQARIVSDDELEERLGSGGGSPTNLNEPGSSFTE